MISSKPSNNALTTLLQRTLGTCALLLAVLTSTPSYADRCITTDCRTVCRPVPGGRWCQQQCRRQCWRETQQVYVARPEPVNNCGPGMYRATRSLCCQNGSIYDATVRTCVWPQRPTVPLSHEAKTFWQLMGLSALVAVLLIISGGYSRNRREIAVVERRTERALSDEEMLSAMTARLRRDAAAADALIKRQSAKAYAKGLEAGDRR